MTTSKGFMIKEREKESKNAGENPYLHAAGLLGVRKEFEAQVARYLASQRTPSDYQELIDWEVSAFNEAYKTKHGGLPQPGDIENLLPRSEVTEEAKALIPELQALGIQVAIVSSGFNYLVKPSAEALNIPPELALANDLVYKDNKGLVDIKVAVSGDKVSALEKVTTTMVETGIAEEETAYVDDNNWGRRGMEHKLNQGGHVFYLGKDSEKDEPLPEDDQIRSHPNFHPIERLTDIANHALILNREIKGIVFDADGTVIDAK